MIWVACMGLSHGKTVLYMTCYLENGSRQPKQKGSLLQPSFINSSS